MFPRPVTWCKPRPTGMLSRVYDPRTRFRELVVTDPAPAARANSSSPTLARSQHFGGGIAEVEQAPPKPWKPPAGWRKWPRKFTALILHDALRHAELARYNPSSAAVEQEKAKGLSAAVEQAEWARTNASSVAAAAEETEGLMRTLQGEVVRRNSAADERAEVS